VAFGCARIHGHSDLRPASELGGLSERARRAFVTFLARTWTEQMRQWSARSPYNLSAFPASSLEAESNATVDLMFEVLRWRAAVQDCLSAIGQFLQPAAPNEICRFCLTEFAPEKSAPDQSRVSAPRSRAGQVASKSLRKMGGGSQNSGTTGQY
jgi:hypothetical protein